ncbi:MAG: protein translocase subunit SecD [Pseudomonadota bacterium]
MLHFTAWKTTLILLAVMIGAFFAQPNLYTDEALESFPDFIPSSKMNLGLDLQGGVHLQVKVERDGIIKERVQTVRSDIRRLLREDRIGYTGLSARGTTVQVRIRDAAQIDAAKAKLEEITRPVSNNFLGGESITELEFEEPEAGLFRYSLTDEGIANRLASAVSQSIEVIRNRVDELGTTEPNIQRQGEDRIIVQVPGFNDPERLKGIIGTTAQLNFHEVDLTMSATDALAGRPPVGSEVMMSTDPEPRPLLIKSIPVCKGEDLEDAQPGFDQQTNEPIVTFRFNTKGARCFGNYSSANVGRPFAIVLDNEVISDPVIRQPILGGNGQISGSFTPESANDLAILMRAGALPADITFVEERTVGPSLGQDAIEAGGISAILAGVLVLVFMILAYGVLGIIANLALIANMILIIGALSALGATLTLPGIAGIVLTMGMAVDANVLIFERIREERRAGRSLIQSFDIGFKQALATILDANITTLIAAVILFYLGSGPIRGFAVTLAIGILTSVFTAFTLTRLMVSLWIRNARPTELPRRFIVMVKEQTSFVFMRLRKISFPASAALLIGSLVMFVTVDLNYGIDFQGGTLIEVQTKDKQPADPQAIRAALSDYNLGDVQVQAFGTPIDVLIRIEAQGGGENAEQSVIAKARDALEADFEFRRVEVVGPTVSSELAQAGTIAVLAALFAILCYIWFRFEWQFAVGAVLATTHDVIMTIGMFAVLQLEFNLSSIAAILTIVGYSLNDTVVVYDRIRENLRKYKKMAVSDLLDMSINHTLSRTILTSVTTLLALLALFFFGGEVLKSFIFAMIFGVFVGTYSSVFIAAPLLILFKLRPGALDPKDPSPYTGQEAQEVA